MVKGALNTRKRVYAVMRHAAIFHDGVGESVDVEEVSEDKNKPKWQFGLEEARGRKHRIFIPVEDQKSSSAYGAIFGAFRAERQECVMG